MEELGRTAFAYSPLSEVTSSMRMLSSGEVPAIHWAWYEAVRPSLGQLDLSLLMAVMPYRHHLPDFLLTPVAGTTTHIDSQLKAVSAVSPARLRAAVSATWAGAAMPTAAADLLASGSRGPARLAEAISDYWYVALEPYWSSIRAALDDDLTHRSMLATGGGLASVIDSLHPDLNIDGGSLRIAKSNDGAPRPPGHCELVLVPSVFVWPHLAYASEFPNQLSLTYGVRRLPQPWLDLTPPRVEPNLAALIGRTRGTILMCLELPQTTTELADRLGQSPSSVNQHLTLLHRSGLVNARRSGRSVLYQRTPTGDALLASPLADTDSQSG